MSLLKYTINILAICLSCGHVSNAACPSFNINYPPMRTLLCPGDIITYTCALSSGSVIVNTQWTGSPGFQCSTPGSPVNTIVLTQTANASLNTVSVSCGNLSAVMANISGTCYTSVLTIPTPQYFNGTTVMCKDGNNALIGSDTLNIQLASPPNAPTIKSLISTYSDQLTVTWTSVPTATSYNVSVNDSVNTLVSILPSGSLQNTFIGLTNNTVYTVSVVAINCAGSSSLVLASNRTAAAVVQPSSSVVPTSSVPSSQTPTVATTTTPQSTTGSGIRETAGVSIVVAMALVLLMLK